jgi:hypothetical protein
MSCIKRYASIISVVIALLIISGWYGDVKSVAAHPYRQGGDDIQLTATVDRTSISTDQTLTLQVTLAGAFRNANKPQLPPLDGFAVVGSSQSSQFSLVNGQLSSKVIFTYRLQPTKTGQLTIPAITIQMRGQTYETDPIAVEVTQGQAPAPQQPSRGQAPEDVQTPQELAGQDLYVEASVDTAAPVIGQQIIYSFRVYQGVQFFNQPQLSWPEFTGFLSYDLSPNHQFYQKAAGREYLVTEVRRALFPTTEGEVSIEPSILTIPGDFFNETVKLATQNVTVDVRPLPEGAPEAFSGAVGAFEIEASCEPTQTRVNEPVTLVVRVWGKGNVNTIPDPTQGAAEAADGAAEALAGWRVYDPQVTTDIQQEGDAIQGEKRFERLLVPKVEGTLTLPRFKFAYFDPASGEYRHIETEPLNVVVNPGEAQEPGPVVIGNNKQDVVVLGSDIRHIKPAPPALPLATSPSPKTWRGKLSLAHPLYWIGWSLPLLAVIGTWAWDRRRRYLQQDVAYARKQRAPKLAHKRLNEARKLANDEGTAADTTYAAVARALTHYVGDKFNLPSAGLTRDAIRRALIQHRVPEAAVARALTCLDWADSGRFAPVAAGRNAEDLVQEAEDVIVEIEKAVG